MGPRDGEVWFVQCPLLGSPVDLSDLRWDQNFLGLSNGSQGLVSPASRVQSVVGIFLLA